MDDPPFLLARPLGWPSRLAYLARVLGALRNSGGHLAHRWGRAQTVDVSHLGIPDVPEEDEVLNFRLDQGQRSRGLGRVN